MNLSSGRNSVNAKKCVLNYVAGVGVASEAPGDMPQKFRIAREEAISNIILRILGHLFRIVL